MHSDFSEALWDNSDPLYAPFLKKKKGRYAYWQPSQKYIDHGWSIKSYRLQGVIGDGLDETRAKQCRELTRELCTWWEGEADTSIKAGTWGWLIKRYLTDEHSAIFEVSPATRDGYKKFLPRIEDAIGDVAIDDTDFAAMASWRKAMESKGRSTHFVKKWFRHFGIVVSHGIKLEVERCRTIKSITREMRITSPPRRAVYADRSQIEAVVAQADADGKLYLSLAVLLRFEFALRGVDVYGQWSPADGREEGIFHHGLIWSDGLTWEMIEPDLSSFCKVINKTKKTLPEPYQFDLTATPHIQERFASTPASRRFGPVIVLEDGTPPKKDVIPQSFRRIARNLGFPDLQIRDARSGAITEAKALVDPMTLRNAAQHTQMQTTDIYVRDRSESANKVVKLRQELGRESKEK
ncbi:hypothetical protein [uncultured Pelagimonas sp.]|uniref:hypothetical protein n=1 Tax=uncultured Pelagimonas sp. TaxID=1618102 RepID=UPI00261A5A46|nr:hypothetical protein [uncultured Pelagimonas sp.]